MIKYNKFHKKKVKKKIIKILNMILKKKLTLNMNNKNKI